MEFEIGKILLLEKANPPKIEVSVSFREDKPSSAQSGTLTVCLDHKDYIISDIKSEALKAAKRLLVEASKMADTI